MNEHETLSALSREELCALLEERLESGQAGEEPFSAVRPILDELDRREGAVPFDVEAGWTALTAERPKGKRPRRRLLFAAAVLLLAAGCGILAPNLPAKSAEVIQGIHDAFVEYFNAEPEQETVLESMAEQPEVSYQEDRVAVNVLQTISDGLNTYVVYEILVPETMDLPEHITSMNDFLYVKPENWDERSSGRGSTKILEVTPHRILAMSSYHMYTREPQSLYAVLWFSDRLTIHYYRDDPAQDYFLFLSRKEVCLQWEIEPDPDSVWVWPLDVSLEDGRTLSGATLSPFGLVVFVDGVYGQNAGAMTAEATFHDGRTQALGTGQDAGGSQLYPDNPDFRFYLEFPFDQLLDLDAVETLTLHSDFGDLVLTRDRQEGR